MTKKVAVITCYKDPDYVRSRSLRAALKRLDKVELIDIKNSRTGFMRYIEVPLKTLWIRLVRRPDVYILAFRGYEILPVTRLITIGKQLYFDEFINLIEWVVYEHKKLKEGSFLHRLLFIMYRFMLLRVQKILTDTSQHADYSSKLMKIPRKRFVAIPVGTDETLFRPQKYTAQLPDTLEVFYYGSMLPLHGVEYVYEAALILKDEAVHFTLIGGNQKIEEQIIECINQGANITYIKRVAFEELPKYVKKSDVCLAGPFGKTVQASMVITGKAYQFLACERLTVVGNIGENLFRDKENCLLVERGDTGELVDAIKWAKNNPKKLKKIAHAGRRLYEENLSVDRVAEDLATIL